MTSAVKGHVDEDDKLTRQIVVSGQRRNVWLSPSATPSSASKAACRSTPSRSLVHQKDGRYRMDLRSLDPKRSEDIGLVATRIALEIQQAAERMR